MATLKVIDQNKSEVGEISLAPEVFAVEIKPEIMHLVVRAMRAAKRAGTHATKTRGEVAGGTHKPWRQKGTGRARAGTIRSPLWRGGGIVFGPQPRDYSFKVNKKIRRMALKMALSSRVASEDMLVVDNFELPEIKTKLFAGVAQALGLKKALIVVGEPDKNLALSARNIQGITVLEADKVNVLDVLSHRQLVMSRSAVASVEERLK